MNGLGAALLADGPHASLGEQAHVFDRFVGAWDCHDVHLADDGTSGTFTGLTLQWLAWRSSRMHPGGMASWGEFAAAEPEFAERVLERFTLRKHSTLATLRHDGSPRISGTEVSFDGGELWLGMMRGR
jgi:hypothetical protein